MTPEELNALADRVERLEGADREVDLEIARIQQVVCLRRNADDTENEEFTHWRYTASIDAAMTLVPPKYAEDFIIICNSAYLGPDYMYFLEGAADHYANAATPALALTAAALRARATMEGGHA